MLKKVNSLGNPVARIKAKTMKANGALVSNNSHYDTDRQPPKVLLCVGARVCLTGVNLNPLIGLYHGSMGIVRDIVYDDPKSPNTDDLPSYVLVEFVQYCGENFIPGLPRYVPVPAQTVMCNNKCCFRTYIPLTLAYGKTAHTFQGQNVGPVPPGRPLNSIEQIVVEPGTRQFEGIHCGLFYTCLGRGTSLGILEDKLSSAVYFDGKNFCRSRFENLTMSSKNCLYKKARLRKVWVHYLKEHELRRNRWTQEEIQSLFNWAQTTIITDLLGLVDRWV